MVTACVGITYGDIAELCAMIGEAAWRVSTPMTRPTIQMIHYGRPVLRKREGDAASLLRVGQRTHQNPHEAIVGA